MLKLCCIPTVDGLSLYGTHHFVESSDKPLILIAHGYFSSNRVGPHRLYYQIADSLENKGYNVVRFDLRGMGESDGQINNVKYKDHVSDLNTIVKTLSEKLSYDQIILIAHCIGCNVSLPVIEANSSVIDHAIFISPFFSTQATLDAFFTQEQQNELWSQGYTYRKGIYSDLTFFSESNTFSNFTEATKKLNNMISTISASNDQFINKEEINNYYNATLQKKIIVQNADHNYLDIRARRDLIAIINTLVEGRAYSERNY